MKSTSLSQQSQADENSECSDYSEIEIRLRDTLDLERDCVFILKPDTNIDLLEYVFPTKLSGNIVPVNRRTVAGISVISRRAHLSNSLQFERMLSSVDWLLRMSRHPIQKMLTCPIIFSDKVLLVVQVARRGETLSESGDNFTQSDAAKIQMVLSDLSSVQEIPEPA